MSGLNDLFDRKIKTGPHESWREVGLDRIVLASVEEGYLVTAFVTWALVPATIESVTIMVVITIAALPWNGWVLQKDISRKSGKYASASSFARYLLINVPFPFLAVFLVFWVLGHFGIVPASFSLSVPPAYVR